MFSHIAKFCRQTVILAETALMNFAKTDGAAFCSFLSGVSYPLSGIGHEIVMKGLSALSMKYSNVAVSWLLFDFREKAFVYSSGSEDYLYHTGVLIRRFSPHCSQALFEQLEQSIRGWIDDKEWVKDRLKRRLDTWRKSNILECFPYWGGFQKTLLPYLDANRLSQYGRELLAVLNRNPHIPAPFYHGFCVNAKTVISPVDSYAERLSDKTWLHIISTSDEKMNERFHGREDGEYYVEASHRMFASALGRRAREEPARFAELSLSFPENCFPEYVWSIFYAIADSTNGKSEVSAEVSVVCEGGLT